MLFLLFVKHSLGAVISFSLPVLLFLKPYIKAYIIFSTLTIVFSTFIYNSQKIVNSKPKCLRSC